MAALLQCDQISLEVLKGFWILLSVDGNALSNAIFILEATTVLKPTNQIATFHIEDLSLQLLCLQLRKIKTVASLSD